MAIVRPPKWLTNCTNRSHSRFDFTLVKEKQESTLRQFRQQAAQNNWDAINSDHFDWWMFPIDDGRLPDFNLAGQADVDCLLADPKWVSSYRESIMIVCKAMGWNLEISEPIIESSATTWQSIPYGNKDVRLAKMIRSAWLLEMSDVFASLHAFAHYINGTIYSGKGFYYGDICLDEILYMKLPRQV